MPVKQAGNEGSVDLRDKQSSCWRVIRRSNIATCVSCGALSCGKCKAFRRRQHTRELIGRIDVCTVFVGKYHGSRDYLRQKIRGDEYGGEYAFFPQEDGDLLVVTNVALPGYEQWRRWSPELEEWIFDAYMAVPVGARVSYSEGWGKPKVLPGPSSEPSKRQVAEPVYGHRVGWDEFKEISERHGIVFKRFLEGTESYVMVGLEEMGGFERMFWEMEVGSYEIKGGYEGGDGCEDD